MSRKFVTPGQSYKDPSRVLKIYAAHVFMPTESSSGYVGPLMGHYEFLVHYTPHNVRIKRRTVSKVTTQRVTLTMFIEEICSKPMIIFPRLLLIICGVLPWLPCLTRGIMHTNLLKNEKCFSYCSNPFETISMKIEPNIADQMIRGSPNYFFW